MEKVKESPELRTGCVKLYLDDISSIVESMQAINENGKLKITVGGYQFSSIEDLSEIKQKEHNEIDIMYEMSSPYGSMTFRAYKKHTHLEYYQSDNSLAFRGAFSNIEKIVIARRRKWGWVEKFFWGATSLGLPVAILIMLGQVNNNPTITTIGILFSGIMLVAFVMFLVTIPVRVSKIILVEKIEHSTFWKRNKDKIWIAFISSLMTLAGTLFIQSLGK
jgi:hypothetical protein